MGEQFIYDPIAIVEFQGQVDDSGTSSGHYICYVKDSLDEEWFFTNDNYVPQLVNEEDISNLPYVTLYKRRI